jgi:uncharacterized DUF497 family protein
MPILELLWDDWNVEHIARHHVTPEEVENLCFNQYWELNAGGGKRALYGQTSGGRYLLVIGVHRGGGLFYPISARDMARTERRRYQEHWGR